MKKTVMVSLVLIVGIVAFLGIYGVQELDKINSDDPRAWEGDIAELVANTEAGNPPEDAVLFVGSSSIRLWDTLADDMAPLPVIRHGFGGAKIYDVVYYAEPLITRWNAPKVVIFVSSNDINGNDDHEKAPVYIGKQLRALFEIIFSVKPETEVFYIAITPTEFSWDKWESVKRANTIASQVCDEFENATYIETANIFLDENGEPNSDLFLFDGLHLNDDGYKVWTDRIKPFLLAEKEASQQSEDEMESTENSNKLEESNQE